MSNYISNVYAENGESHIHNPIVVEEDGAAVVFMDHTGEYPLDPDRGAEITIKLPKGCRYMADRRHTEFWCSPYFGTDPGECPGETQLLIYEKDGLWGVIVPVVSEKYKCVLEGKDGALKAVLYSWYCGMKECRAPAFVTAEGSDPFWLVSRCVRIALGNLNNGTVVREERRYPEIFEYLGWCSWDALQIRVSEEGLVQKCEEFKEKNVPVKWAIIDDMWAEIAGFNGASYSTRGEMFALMHSSSMYDFEASYTRFPDGLGHAVDRIHSYGIKVGMWHPTTGYWCGLDPAGEAYRKLRPYTFVSADGKIISDWHEEKAFGYFNTMHRFFRKCGADFLKVDNQSMTRRFYKYAAPVGEVTHEWHRGLEASVGLNFDNTMINCMGMASEDMWNRPFSSICRCSDDFQPEDRPWFTKHILQCTYNSVLQGQFYWNDYDMWWTDDSQAEKNSLLRAVSGGPVYVSDEIGRTRPEVLKPLAFDDGRILRCDRSGMPTKDCLLDNPETSSAPLKIQNITGKCGVVAAFNITKEQNEVSGTVKPSDVPDIEGDKFVVYEHFSKSFEIVGFDEAVHFSLKNIDDYRLFVIVPYINGFAALGRTDKFVSPAAITAQIGENVTLYEGGEYSYVRDGKLYTETKK